MKTAIHKFFTYFSRLASWAELSIILVFSIGAFLVTGFDVAAVFYSTFFSTGYFSDLVSSFRS
jgi:hypothetical protein